MVKKPQNYYQMLGVQPEVTSVEIKRAYRQLVKSHHPDVEYHVRSESERNRANEYMATLNEAYETLIDKRRRAEYDTVIGANGHRNSVRGKHPKGTADDGEQREMYLRMLFHPGRQSIVRVLKKYKEQLTELAQDIYDDQLVSAFEQYLDDIENTLRKSSNGLSSKTVPRSLVAAVQMMRYSIAQAVDGLEEARRFCQNYDYDHLHMAGNLFQESIDLSRQAMQLTKS